MGFTKYNLKKIIRIELKNQRPANFLEFKKEEKPIVFLGIPFSSGTKEGFYSKFFMNEYLGNECPEQHQLINGIVYEDYMVIITFESNIKFVKWFKTHEEAFSYADGVIKKSGEQHILNI